MSDWITPDEVKEHHDNGYEAGVAHERERIIALLEDNLYEDYECSCEPCAWVRKVFAIIKGENE